MGKKVLMPAQLSSVNTLKDRSIKLTFTTRELGGDDSATLFNLAHGEGWLLFSANDDVAEADVPLEKADPMIGQKSQSQRLRGVIYVLWEQRGRSGSYEDFYRSYTERLIEQIKEQLR